MYALLSVVIPCKNEEKNILQTLQSLENQTFDMNDVPVIIADAGSTDTTLDIIAEFQKHSKMDIQVTEGGYPPAGRNNGARQSTSQYILFLRLLYEMIMAVSRFMG